MLEKFRYTAVIRTLGTAGEKYQTLLESLMAQTIRPSDIIVYIADGFELPKETVGFEHYVYVKKGMVAQRALQYDEVQTDYILFLDDDLYLPPDTVEKLYNVLLTNHADVVSPDIFPNHKRTLLSRLMMTVSGRMIGRSDDGKWGYKVIKTGGYSYNIDPKKESYLSQTNAGACFLCTKNNFLKIHFKEELWLDEMKYALGDDQVMYYKMYKLGLKVITLYKHGIQHLDAGCNMTPEKEKRRLYADLYFKIIFWHRFLFSTEINYFSKFKDICCLVYILFFTLFISLIRFKFSIFYVKCSAIKKGILYIKSDKYKSIPRIK